MSTPPPTPTPNGLRNAVLLHLAEHPASAAKLEFALKTIKLIFGLLSGVCALLEAYNIQSLWSLNLSWVLFVCLCITALAIYSSDSLNIYKNKIKDEKLKELEASKDEWEEKLKLGIDNGFARCLSEWNRVAGHQESAMYKLSRQVTPVLSKLDKKRDGVVNPDAVDGNMMAIYIIFASLYQDLDGEMSINLVKRKNNRTFEMLRIYPGNNGRGAKVPREIRHAQSGYADAHKKGEITTRHFDEPPSQSGYRSIASLPIKGLNNQVVGVINIDSSQRDLFQDLEQLTLVCSLCRGNLAAVAIALGDKRMQWKAGEIKS